MANAGEAKERRKRWKLDGLAANAANIGFCLAFQAAKTSNLKKF